MKISHKILLLAIGAVVSSSVAVVLISTYEAKISVVDMSKAKLEALSISRKNSLGSYLDSIKADVEAISSNDNTLQALEEFNAAWKEIPSGTEETLLQKLYINDNPNPTGQKEKLDVAPDSSKYSAMHAKYHPWFRSFLQKRGYYDIFLINNNGDVVYTVFKELDFASNVIKGSGKDTDLGAVYKNALANPKEAAFVDFKPYAISANAPAAFISHAITNKDGSPAGVLVFQMPIEKINGIMKESAGMGESGETYIVGSDMLMRSDSRFSKESTLLKQKVDTEAVKEALAGKTGSDIIKDYRGIDVFSAYTPLEFLGVKYAMIGEQDEDEVMKPLNSLINNSILFSSLVVLIFGAVAFFVSRGISQPLIAILKKIKILEKGNTSFEVENKYKDRSDEVGELARSIESFRETSMLTKSMEDDMRQKDLQMINERKNNQEKIAVEFEQSVKSIVGVVASSAIDLARTAKEMAQSVSRSSQLASSANDMAVRTTGNVQSVASAAEELSSSVREISGQLQKTSDLVNESRIKAENADSLASALTTASDRVAGAMDMISAIAGQINLLALNATIESARAGEAGKGFAVVASEVKNLATQTDKTINEIQSVIGEMRGAASSIVTALNEIKFSVNSITEATSSVASAVEEQSAVTNEIAQNMQVAATGTQTISDNMGDVSTSSSNSGLAAEKMVSSVQELADKAESLNAQVDAFLMKIRA